MNDKNKELKSFQTLFDESFIGFDRIFDLLANSPARPDTYPPHNLIKLNDKQIILSLPVVGRTKENVNINLNRGKLIINVEAAEGTGGEFMHHGIALRAFTKSFSLHEYLVVTKAEVKDGLLNILLDYIIPEEKRPVQIEVE